MLAALLGLLTPAVFNTVLGLVDKAIPDKEAADKIKLAIIKEQSQVDIKKIENQLTLDLNNLEVNKIEASSESKFKSWWRPAVAWMCVAAFGLNYLLFPIVILIGQLVGTAIQLPQLDMAMIMGLLTGMLGLGTLRTVEKLKATNKAPKGLFDYLRTLLGPLSQEQVDEVNKRI